MVNCPATHSCVFALGMSFWVAVVVGEGVILAPVLNITVLFSNADYSDFLSRRVGDATNPSGICADAAKFRATTAKLCA